MTTIRGAVTDEDAKTLQEVVFTLFTKPQKVGVSEHGGKGKRGRKDNEVQPARCLKTQEEIADAWNLIMTRRREYETDHATPILSRKTRENMYNQWLNDFREYELDSVQQTKSSSDQSSIFRAYLYKNCGGIHFVMAVWQTGLTWLVPEHLANDNRGATEHAAKEFAKWVLKFARAIQKHKENEKTMEAQRNAGKTWGQSGLTREERYQKKQRDHARWNYNWAAGTERRLQYTQAMSKGKSKGYAKAGKGKDFQPLHYGELHPAQQQLIDQYRSGELRAHKKDWEAVYRGNQADAFEM